MALTDELVRALGDVSSDISVSSTLPPACYSGTDVLAAELSGLLRRSWLGVARADELKAPGDYRVLELAGTSTILVRDDEGRLRAFANVCRHRGTRLLDGAGNAAHIRCPFHGWTYGLDGSLRGATRMGATRGFRHADMGLSEFRTAERGGFVFVTSTDETPDIDDWLGSFDSLLAPWQLQDLVTIRRRELDVDCNWKLFLEVFNESYHLEYVHCATFGGIYLEPEPPDEVGDCVHSSFSPTAGTGGLRADEQDHVLPAMPGPGCPRARRHPVHLGLSGADLRRRRRGAVGLRRATARPPSLPGHPVGVLSAPYSRCSRIRGRSRQRYLARMDRGARGGHRGAGAPAARYGLTIRPGRALVGSGARRCRLRGVVRKGVWCNSERASARFGRSSRRYRHRTGDVRRQSRSIASRAQPAGNARVSGEGRVDRSSAIHRFDASRDIVDAPVADLRVQELADQSAAGPPLWQMSAIDSSRVAMVASSDSHARTS